MFETHKKDPAMRHHNTVFHGVLKLVPWRALDRLVERYQANKRVRRLSTQNQFVAMLYAQLSDAQSLRAIEASFESHAARLYHLGASELSRSTLADANAKRSCAVFTELLSELMGGCERSLASKVAEAVYLVDSTSLRLNSLSADWARFSPGVHGAKLHIVYNPDTGRPSFAELTPANVNESSVAEALIRFDEAAVYADKAYAKAARRVMLKTAGIKDRIMHKSWGGGPPLTAWQKRHNRLIAPVRAAVETVFAVFKRRMGYTRLRYRGLLKNSDHLFILATAYNIRRVAALVG